MITSNTFYKLFCAQVLWSGKHYTQVKKMINRSHPMSKHCRMLGVRYSNPVFGKKINIHTNLVWTK